MINSLQGACGLRKRVLIVEDNVMHAELLKIIIQSSYDVDITVAVNGTDALDKVSADCPFDLIIMDIMIPKMNGIDVLKTIRKGHKAVPVFMVSALSDDDTVKRSLTEGATGYFTKPIKKDSLRETVGSCLDIACKF